MQWNEFINAVQKEIDNQTEAGDEENKNPTISYIDFSAGGLKDIEDLSITVMDGELEIC